MRRISRVIGAAMLAGLLATALPTGATQAQDDLCFPETGACISGRFRSYWEQNGGLPVFGYPIGAAHDAPNRDNGQTYLTQWFERARFELHSGNPAPHDVLLGRLGDDQLINRGVDWRTTPGAEVGDGCLAFNTGHAICDTFSQQSTGFKKYWSSHGLADPKLDAYGRSLALFGLPLTDPQFEFNSSGDWVIAQYFERARFERALPVEGSQVTLGRLGAELSANKLPLTPLIKQEPTAFFSAADETGIVWASRVGDHAMTISSSDLAGNNRRELLASPTAGLRFAVDATHIYWTTSDGVSRAPRAGGPPESIARDIRSPSEMTIDADFIYWGNVSGQINRAPKTGGDPETIVSRQNQIRGIAADDTFIYWVTVAGEFQRVLKAGGATEMLLNSLGDINAAQIVFFGNDTYLAYSYGASEPQGRLIKLAKGGGPITILDESDIPLDVVVNQTYIFWTTISGTIKAARHDGGGAEVIVTGQQMPNFLTINPWGLYWLTVPGTIMYGGLGR